MTSENQIMPVELKKEDLELLLRQKIGPNLKLESFTSKPLTQPGDNYGSTILAVEVIYHQNGRKELVKLPIVAKLVPESPFLRLVFDIKITFRKEVRAYTLVSPAYDQLQKEKGIPESEKLDIFPKYYGSRSNKENNDDVDADDTAVLLLENLKISGFETRDRRKGFNLEHMEMTISCLAKFHALAIALKLLKPQVFKDKIMKTCAKFTIGTVEDKESDEKWIAGTLEKIKAIPECQPYFERIKKSLQENFKPKTDEEPREPYATIVHNDFWVNNMMFKYHGSGDNGDGNTNKESPIAMKFVDFQITIYNSPVRDLIFLLFTSSEDGLIEKQYAHLVQFYYNTFIQFLQELGCDTEVFCFESFQEEFNIYCPKEFPHILFMLNVISADPEGLQEASSVDQESMLKNKGGYVYANKVRCMVETFVANGWL